MSGHLYTILAIILAFILSLACVPQAIRLAYKVGAVDRPNERKVHSRIMPRLGGTAIFASFTISLLLFARPHDAILGMVLGASVVFIVGVLDDIYQLSPGVKLVGQSLAAVLAICFGVIVQFVSNPFDGSLGLGYLSIPLTFLWIVGVTNAVNLIDGLDGLAAGVSGIAACTMAVLALVQGQYGIALVAFILAAAIAGFLPYNFYPARTFMGDGGSNFLGFCLSCLAVLGTTKTAALISLFIPIVILGIPILDTLFAIVRRIHNRAPIMMPDKDHLHHRLMALGMSHRRSVITIYFISGLFAVVAITLTLINNSPKASVVLALLLLLVVLGADKVGLFTGDRRAPGTRIRDAGQVGKVKL